MRGLLLWMLSVTLLVLCHRNPTGAVMLRAALDAAIIALTVPTVARWLQQEREALAQQKSRLPSLSSIVFALCLLSAICYYVINH